MHLTGVANRSLQRTGLSAIMPCERIEERRRVSADHDGSHRLVGSPQDLFVQKELEVKRIILAACLTLGFATAGVSALGVGGAFSLGVLGGLPNSALFSIKLDSAAPVLGIGVAVGTQSARIGGTADWWLYNKKLSGPFSTYIGVGAYLDVQTGSSATVGLGVRMPVGLQLFPVKPLELFLEVAPRAGLTFNPVKFPDWGLQGAFGFRFWL